jgi:hypothetical protein
VLLGAVLGVVVLFSAVWGVMVSHAAMRTMVMVWGSVGGVVVLCGAALVAVTCSVARGLVAVCIELWAVSQLCGGGMWLSMGWFLSVCGFTGWCGPAVPCAPPRGQLPGWQGWLPWPLHGVLGLL